MLNGVLNLVNRLLTMRKYLVTENQGLKFATSLELLVDRLRITKGDKLVMLVYKNLFVNTESL